MTKEGTTRLDLTVIIVSYNTAHLLDRLFTALYRSAKSLSLQVIVVENASRDDSLRILESRYPEVKVIRNEVNVGFGRANNIALELVQGRYVLLLNTDAFVSPDTLEKTIAYMEADRKCGILGVRLTGEDGSLQPSCRFFPTPFNVFVSNQGLSHWFPRTRLVDDPTWDPSTLQECDWVPGCYYLVRREVIDQVGLFDPSFFLYYEEVDHCRRAKAAGWKVVYYPDTQVIHIGGESAQSVAEVTKARQISVLQVESELLYFRKHHGITGFIAFVVLVTTSGMLDAFKRVIKGRTAQGAAAALRHIKTVLSTAAKTRLGTRATR